METAGLAAPFGLSMEGGVLRLRLKDQPARQDAHNYPLRYTQRALFSDVDGLRHLNNGAIGRLFEEGRAQANLIMFHEINGLRPGANKVLVRLLIEFLVEGHYPGEIEVCSGISSIGTSSVVHAH